MHFVSVYYPHCCLRSRSKTMINSELLVHGENIFLTISRVRLKGVAPEVEHSGDKVRVFL